MKPILEYIISKNSKTIKMIHATNATIKKIVKDELDRLGHNADLNHIDVSEVTCMDFVFSCGKSFLGEFYNDLNPNISGWDVSKVKTMYSMFYSCIDFNCDISNWDVSNVIDMKAMFINCNSFNRDLSKWNINKNCDHITMFDNCPIKEEYKPKF